MIVLFDLDSTLVTIEGLDWVADQKGLGDKVKELTRKSMDGDLPFEAAFSEKLKMLAPSRGGMNSLAEKYCHSFVPGVKQTIKALKSKGYDVGIVTSNFGIAVYPVAEELGIAKEFVFANEMFFDQNGQYSSLDRDNPLASNGGKGKVVQEIKDPHIVFVGDSVTDLETKPYVQLFIGFGGVAERPIVKQNADAYVADKDIRAILPLLTP